MNTKARLIVLLAALFAPSAFAASIFITSRDSGIADLYQYSLAGALLQTIPGNGLNNGQGVVVGPDGKVYVASEGGGSVLRYDATTGAFLSTFATGLGSAGALAFGSNGHLYVGSASKILELDSSGLLAATIGLGTGLSSVSGLAFDTSGNLYVSDGVTGRINKFSPAGAFLSTIVSANTTLASGAGALLVNGSTLLVSDTFGSVGQNWGSSILAFGLDGAAHGSFISDAHLNGPAGMAFGPDGNFYVVNYAGGNVVRFTAAGSFVDTFIPDNPPSGRFIAFAPNAIAPVPEPTSVAMLGLGLLALAVRRRIR